MVHPGINLEHLFGDTAFEHSGQRVDGLSPALGGMPFDEPAGGGALVAGLAAFLFAGSGAFVLDVGDGQPDQLDDGAVGGELSAVLDDLSDLVVEALDRVGRVDDLSDFGWERQKRAEPVPGAFPYRDGGLVLAAQWAVGEFEQRLFGGLDGGGGVDGFERG